MNLGETKGTKAESGSTKSQFRQKYRRKLDKLEKSKTYLDYKYRQLKLSKESTKHCDIAVVQDYFARHCRFEKGFQVV